MLKYLMTSWNLKPKDLNFDFLEKSFLSKVRNIFPSFASALFYKNYLKGRNFGEKKIWRTWRFLWKTAKLNSRQI